ncbi:MAG: Ig-like domain-containing protein [Gammaproteobacteria bacterium]|nr:Ig-like domain-containing protein [Gammaproteobacteria bacterium]
MRDWIKLIMVITFSLVLAACGGDGLGTSNSTGQDTTVPDPDPDVPVPTSNATNITLEVSSRQMPSDGSNTVTLTAVARDNSNRYVENTTIEFSASSGGILPGERTITNSSGRVSATLDVGGDPANRTITVTAVDSVTGQSASQLVEVRDTQFVFSGPQRIEVGESAELVVQLVDAGGNPIAFETITLISSLGNTIQTPNGLTTDSTGRVTVTVLGGVAGSDIITATAATGLNADNSSFALDIITADAISFYFDLPVDNAEVALGANAAFRVCLTDSAAAVAAGTVIQISSTRGAFGSSGGAVASYSSNGVATCWDDTLSNQGAGFAQVLATTSSATTAYDGLSASKLLEFISTTVSQVNVQAEKSILVRGEQTQIVATLRDSHYNLVKNRTVSFSIDADASNGNLNPPTAITNSNGEATVVYTAGMASSGLYDVVIKAQDYESGLFSTTELTVQNRALHVALGTGNTMANYDDESLTSYALPYSAIVTDSAGQPVANQAVSISIWSHRYYKGSYYPTYSPTGGFILYSNAPVDEYQWDVPDDGVINWGRVVTCGNEDTDLNGIADFDEDLNRNRFFDRINEDLNGNGTIDLSEDTNANGILDILEDVNRNGILDPGEDLNGNGKLDATEDINLNGVLDGSEDTNENGVLDVLEDTNLNGRLDPGEDLNFNGVLDATEDLDGDGFLTSEDINRNGILDAGEDTNGDGVLTTEDLNGNGVLDVSEDRNLNGLLDLGEDLNGNGIIDVSEDRNRNGFLDVLEDANRNGTLDPGEDLNGNNILDLSEDINGNGVLDVDEDIDGDGVFDTYEDSNQNGLLDAGEDLNGNGILDLPVDVDVNVNGRLDPGNIATISVDDTIGAFSINTTTDENGVAIFAVIYPENYANWLEVSLTASAIVDGTEDSARVRFRLPALASDLNQEDVPPAGYTSPFGRGYDAGTRLIQGCTVDEI